LDVADLVLPDSFSFFFILLIGAGLLIAVLIWLCKAFVRD
jgi:hypothetical protein